MNIPIFFSSNDNYIPYVSVMMQSIMENAQKGRKYEFYVLHRDIKNETMEKLQKQISLFPDFSLNFVDMSPYVKDNVFFISGYVTIETYFRLFIPYIFPNMEKIIYLDGDMVCLVDISKLFDVDICDYLLAGVRDVLTHWYYMPEWKRDKRWFKVCEVLLSMERPENYINAGMLLLNCNKFRETYTMQKVIDTINSRKWRRHDQDVINVLSENKILHIHNAWDYMLDEKYAKYLPENLLSEFMEAKNNPKIIHYKPYSKFHYIQYFEEFWKYATRTPYIKEIVDRMNKNGIIEKGLKDKVFFTLLERIGLLNIIKKIGFL